MSPRGTSDTRGPLAAVTNALWSAYLRAGGSLPDDSELDATAKHVLDRLEALGYRLVAVETLAASVAAERYPEGGGPYGF